MLVQYSLKSFRSGQLIQGEIYLVIEIYIDFERDITITHKLIFEAGTNTFWEVYFDNPTNNERALLDNVVKDLSLREGIPAPMLEHNECS